MKPLIRQAAKKQAFRMIVDLLMAILMLGCMAYQMTGNFAHEVLGMVLLLVFILHHILNRHWYGALLKGRYRSRRVMLTLTNAVLLVLTLLMMVTGIVLSRDLFPLFHLEDDFIVRQLHTFSSNWGLLAMGFHLGLHLQTILGTFARSFGRPGRLLLWPGRLLMAGIAVYGVAAFFRLALDSKLLMQTTFGYWDFQTDAPGFFLSYLAVMSIATALAHYTHMLLSYWFNREAKKPMKDASLYDDE